MADTSDSFMRPGNRLMSLDFFRGFIMFLLIAEATGIYDVLNAPSLKGTFLHAIIIQFQHPEWNGLRLWDLGQPFFMFISGVAMVFSYEKRWEKGAKWGTTFLHALERSFLLFVFGWAIYFINPVVGGPSGAFLYDILPQLAFASLIAFLMMRRFLPVQIALTFGILMLTECLYRFWAVPGFNQPFVPGHNFGSYIDMLLMGKLSEGHWVAFNSIPLVCHTIWGVAAGRLLKSQRRQLEKIRILLAAGVVGVAAGYGLSFATPIIRRIATSSFVILAGGFSLLALALSYWLIDVLKFRKWAKFFVIVGMNPLFIFLFSRTGGAEWFHNIAQPFALSLFGWAGERPAQLATSLSVLTLLWSLCYWLSRKKIFIRI